MEVTWDTLIPSATPEIKLETSPTGSLLSDPSGIYPSLFSGSTVASSAAATPTDTGAASMGLFPATGDDTEFASTKTAAFHSRMTPLSEEDPEDLSAALLDSTDDADLDADPTSTSDKKPTKKRKSWGQVLPEPKTNLPPRKRAKTEDEKEQRRVERVLRNRRAAQSSRERKRLEVEALEIRNHELEEQLAKVRRENTMLYERLTQVHGKPAVVTTGAPPVTLSQELFSSQNGHSSFAAEPNSALGPFLNSATIDPVSLSPALNPVPDTTDLMSSIDDHEKMADDQGAEPEERGSKTEQQLPQQQSQRKSEPAAANGAGTSATSRLEPSPDKTHRPAATLCPDLQCLSAEVSQVWTVPKNSTPLTTALFYQTTLLLMLSSTVISACCRPVTQIALLLRAGISIPPTPAILTSIIWVITTPSRHSMARNLTSTTSSMPMGQTSYPAISSSATAASTRLWRPSTTLRLKMLRKILTSNPMLARPIRDATMRVLRSACSEEQLDPVSVGGQVRPGAARATQWSETGISADGSWLNTATLPSKEALLALLWALRVEETRVTTSAKSRSVTSATRVRPGLFGKLAKGSGSLSLKRW